MVLWFTVKCDMFIVYLHVGVRFPVIVVVVILAVLIFIKFCNDQHIFLHCEPRTLQRFTNTSHSECTYNDDITIYMDAFEKLSQGFFGPEYRDFLLNSQDCPPLPGGGRCIYNHEDPCSDAILYYGARHELNYRRLFDDQILIMFTMESESGPYCHFPPADQYEIKISYRRDSTVPKLFLCQDDVAKRLVEMGQPVVSAKNKKLVASFITNCVKWRADYIRELMKYIHIDQWGNCFKNTEGDFWKTRKGHYSNYKIDFLQKNQYKFVISFENNVDVDYVSEKVYDAYLARTIPIYYGEEGIFDLIPGNSTFIYAKDYTPKQLADLIKRIDNDDSLYHQYFTNWDLDKLRKLDEQYCSEYFMCTTCKRVWEMMYERKCGRKQTL